MYTLLVTGDVPGASTYFNPLVQQSVIPCTSGTRPTPSHEGMTIHESDTNAYAKWTGSAWEYQGSSRTSFTPTLSATTTPPTMGTGNSRQGWWCYLPGGQVQYTFAIQFGTSGAAAGSGTYTISLPVTSAAPFGGAIHSSVGTIQLADNSGGVFRVGSCYIPGSSLGVLQMIGDGSAPITNAAPWTWANQDYLTGSIIYPV